MWLAGLLLFFRLTAMLVSFMSYHLHDRWQWHRQPPWTRLLVCVILAAITVYSWCCLTPFQILAPVPLTSVAVMLCSPLARRGRDVAWYSEMAIRFGFAATFIDYRTTGFDLPRHCLRGIFVTVPKSLVTTAATRAGQGGAGRSFMYKGPGAAITPLCGYRGWCVVPDARPGDRLLCDARLLTDLSE